MMMLTRRDGQRFCREDEKGYDRRVRMVKNGLGSVKECIVVCMGLLLKLF